MSGDKPFGGVAFKLSSLGYAVSQGFQRTLAPFDLHPREFAVLRVVGFQEGQSQQALGESLRIPRSRMVAIVDQLERRELLERQPHATDRRVRQLHLTDEGKDLLEQALSQAVAFENEVGAPLNAEERRQLLDLLDRIAGGLGIGPGAHAALRD